MASKGLPQGSVLSPLLYTIYTRKIDNQIENPSKILQLADDIVIYTEIETQAKSIEKL